MQCYRLSHSTLQGSLGNWEMTVMLQYSFKTSEKLFDKVSYEGPVANFFFFFFFLTKGFFAGFLNYPFQILLSLSGKSSSKLFVLENIHCLFFIDITVDKREVQEFALFRR